MGIAFQCNPLNEQRVPMQTSVWFVHSFSLVNVDYIVPDNKQML